MLFIFENTIVSNNIALGQMSNSDEYYLLMEYYNNIRGVSSIAYSLMSAIIVGSTAYDIYKFTPREEVEKDWNFYLQLLLAVILIAFLLFVIFRGMAPVEVTELEPELSVETLLATTKENQSLEDVEFSEQSETRKMIEKFFDENPEAVAQLLRNWLNEDWD